jgi:hypothetical protein
MAEEPVILGFPVRGLRQPAAAQAECVISGPRPAAKAAKRGAATAVAP